MYSHALNLFLAYISSLAEGDFSSFHTILETRQDKFLNSSQVTTSSHWTLKKKKKEM